MDLLEMWDQMGLPVKTLMGVLALMSMWSVGVFFERVFTFSQAQKQSKLFAPQVAKHLKDSQVKDGIAVSQSKNYKYSHLAKVVLAGLQEYQFQQDTGVKLERDDVVDSVRRAIQRASALTSADLKKGAGHSGQPSVRRRCSWGCWRRRLASSTHSRGLLRPGLVVLVPCRAVSRRRSLERRSGCSSRFPPCGSTTISPGESSTSTSRWTTRHRNWWTTSSRSPKATLGIVTFD